MSHQSQILGRLDDLNLHCRTIERVDATMDSIREQTELANEISDAISNPMNVGLETDEEALKDELAALEAEKLDEVLMGAERVPSHVPSGPELVADCKPLFVSGGFSIPDVVLFYFQLGKRPNRKAKRNENYGSYRHNWPYNVIYGLLFAGCDLGCSSPSNRPKAADWPTARHSLPPSSGYSFLHIPTQPTMAVI